MEYISAKCVKMVNCFYISKKTLTKNVNRCIITVNGYILIKPNFKEKEKNYVQKTN